MSLEATHIRFALDLRDIYKIKDIGEYINGTVYPDSRYMTGINRNLTHGKQVLEPVFAIDDFRKGWQLHLLCDNAFNKVKIEIFPDIFGQGIVGFDERDWIHSSAMKIIQDMNDMQQIDIQKYLEYFKKAKNPNGEDLDKVKEYNQALIDLYKDKKVTTMIDNYNFWYSLGIGEDYSDKIIAQTKKYLSDKKIVEKIEGIYDAMIKDYLKGKKRVKP